MIDQSVVTYIKNELLKGTARDIIKTNLISVGGYTAEEVDFHFGIVGDVRPTSPPPPASASLPPAPSAPNVVIVPPVPKEGLPIFKIFIVLIILILLGVGGVYGYGYYVDHQPDKILAKMYSALGTIKSFEYSIENNIETSVATSTAAIDIKQKGDIDISNVSNILSDQNINIGLDFADGDLPFAVVGSVALDSRLVDHTFYMRAVELPAVLSSFIDISLISDRWFVLGTSTVETMADFQPNASSTIELIDKQDVGNFVDGFVTMLQKYPVLIVKKDLGGEELGGISTYHYAIDLDKDQMKTAALVGFKLLSSDVPAGQSAEAQQSVLDAIDSMTLTGGEIWIGKADSFPYKIVGEIASGISKTTFIAIFSGFNQKFGIVAPSDAKPFEEYMTQLSASSTLKIPIKTTVK